MKLSIHRTIRGKPVGVEELSGRKWMESNGQRVNLGYDWINIDAEWPDIFYLITQEGIATSAELSSDNRCDANFVSRQLFMVDIDSGMTIAELLEHPIYKEIGGGYYTTASHTAALPRFRIIFKTETPIYDRDWARLLTMGLMRMFDHADPACKDSTRIFYGTIGAEDCCLMREHIPDYVVAEIIAHELELREQQTETETIDYPELDDQRKQKILTLLQQTYVGQYPTWRNIGWGLKSAGFSLRDFQYVTAGMMRQKTSADAEIVWNDGKIIESGCSLGTVIHLLRERHGPDCLKITADDELEQLARQILMKRKRT